MKDKDEPRDGPAPEAQRFGAIVGRWRSEGHVVGSQPVPVTGTDIYEWVPGGFSLVHHVDVTVGDRPVRAIEIIGERDLAASMTARWERSDDGSVWAPG